MKLISMTDFVLEQNYTTTLDISQIDFYDKELSILSKIRNYANFLKIPLKLEMFVPIDEEGNLLEEPEQFKEWIKSDHYFNASESVTHQCRMYKKSKEKVLFETNYELHVIKDILTSAKIIEDLVTCSKLNITLTPNAIKQLGL